MTGENLQVGTLLSGSVRKAGNRLRITMQLVKVADGSVLASSRYDHDLDDVFALQEAIARATVENVLARIGKHATAPHVRRPTASIEAYNLYLKGRYHLNRRTTAALHQAIPLYEQAIEIDPEFAQAYVGLADAHLQLALFNAEHPRAAAERGKELCRRALDLDPDLPDGRTTLATFQAVYDWDWIQAEAELRRVLARYPECTKARQALAINVLTPLGRFDDALVEMQAALALDPISIPFIISLGFVLHFARRSEEALTQVSAALELGHEDYFTRIVLCELLTDLGRPQDGADLILASPVRPRGPHTALGLCYAGVGRVEKARAILEQFLDPPAGTYTSGYFPALLHISLGELEQALDCLEHAAEDCAPQLTWLGVRPVFDPLRDHPRYQRRLDRVRLPNVRPRPAPAS